MGFIDVNIEFFIGLKLISQTFHEIQTDFSLVHVETDSGRLIVEYKDWKEIKSALRKIKLDTILDN